MSGKKHRPHAELRSLAIAIAKEADHLPCVGLRAAHSEDVDCVDVNITDEDGDNIVARGQIVFTFDEEWPPKFIFRKGSDRVELIRILHKFIAMLAKSEGEQVVNLSEYDYEPNRAERHPDGSVVIYNAQERMDAESEKIIKEARRKQAAQDNGTDNCRESSTAKRRN